MDQSFSTPQCRHFALVVIHTDYVVTQLREANGGRQADVARSDRRDLEGSAHSEAFHPLSKLALRAGPGQSAHPPATRRETNNMKCSMFILSGWNRVAEGQSCDCKGQTGVAMSPRASACEISGDERCDWKERPRGNMKQHCRKPEA